MRYREVQHSDFELCPIILLVPLHALFPVSSLFLQFSVQLCRLSGDQEVPVLHLDIEGLGTELKLRTFDMTSNTYLREICLKCPEYMGQCALDCL